MAEFNSDQIAAVEGTPTTKLRANENEGEVRVARFSFDNTGGTAASSGDTVRLTRLPEKARVLDGKVEVTTTFAGNANIQIGVDGAAGKYSGTIDVDATGVSDFASNTDENGILSTETGDAGEELIATFDTAGGNGAFEGYVLYVQV